MITSADHLRHPSNVRLHPSCTPCTSSSSSISSSSSSTSSSSSSSSHHHHLPDDRTSFRPRISTFGDKCPPSILLPLLLLLLLTPVNCSNSSSFNNSTTPNPNVATPKTTTIIPPPATSNSSSSTTSPQSFPPNSSNATPSPSSDLIASSENRPHSSANLYDLLRTSPATPTNVPTTQWDNTTVANETTEHFQLFSLNWQHIATPFGVSLWLLLASFAKIFFNINKKFAEAVPDSALLIVLGLGLGAVLRLLDVDGEVFTLRARTFFLYLLPPIIFDAGYFMPNRQLFENLDSVLLFAFVGTIWNTLAIGFSLFWMGQLGLFSVPFSAFQILLFASLISAVDPVAVIAVFEEIHINEFLFINVFGEALFNDGVSVVLYQMFRKFIAIGESNLQCMDYLAGIGSFVVIALGGVLIGLLFAVLACIATKFTTRVRILAPVFVFVVPYMSYLTAEMFGLSSILAIVACGISMKQYVKGNLSHDASQSVKYFVKMLAQCSETMIFMFLGLSTVSKPHHWDWAFVGSTIGFCLLFRVIGVVVQCAALNRFRTKKFSFRDQFVLSYGGLRGAIAFGLVVSLDDTLVPKQMFVTTCIVVIFFTVFVQGITIRPLLYWLKVEKNDVDRQETMVEKICGRHCDYMMAGIEDVAGLKGRNAIRDMFERFNAKMLKPALMRDEKREPFDASVIIRAYTKLTLLEAQRLVRFSARKRPPHSRSELGGHLHRVAPAPSPSSATSTLTYCQWSTMENGGKREEDGEENRRPRGTESPEGSEGAEEDQCPPNAADDPLFAKFSQLLAIKMEEAANGMEKREEEEDIKDNYMQSLIHNGAPKRSSAGADRLIIPPPPYDGSRTSRRRHSLSPGMERQMMGSPPASAAVCQLSAAQLRESATARRFFRRGGTQPESLEERGRRRRERK